MGTVIEKYLSKKESIAVVFFYLCETSANEIATRSADGQNGQGSITGVVMRYFYHASCPGRLCLSPAPPRAFKD